MHYKFGSSTVPHKTDWFWTILIGNISWSTNYIIIRNAKSRSEIIKSYMVLDWDKSMLILHQFLSMLVIKIYSGRLTFNVKNHQIQPKAHCNKYLTINSPCSTIMSVFCSGRCTRQSNVSCNKILTFASSTLHGSSWLWI